MSNEHQQRRAMSAAHERHLEPPDDRDPGLGACPVCGEETQNGEPDAHRDEEGTIHRGWTWTPCDTCKAPCTACGDTPTQKIRFTLCADCAADKANHPQPEDTPC